MIHSVEQKVASISLHKLSFSKNVLTNGSKDTHHSPAESGNGRRLRAVLVDGFVRAGWNIVRLRDTATILVAIFEKLAKETVGELSAEAEALLRFMEPDASEFVIDVIRS
jgi:hypothetical protein